MKGLRRRGKDREPQSLASIVEDQLGAFGSSPPIPFKIIRAWDESVGDRVARRARPSRMQGTTLVVKVTSSSWMSELQMLAPQIIERLKARSGVLGLKELRFELGKLPLAAPNQRPPAPEAPRGHGAGQPVPQKIAAALNAIEDPALREQIEAALARTLDRDGSEPSKEPQGSM